MSDEQEEQSSPGIVGRAGRGLFKLIGGGVLGIVLVLGGFLALVWGEARVNIATAIEAAPSLNDDEEIDAGPMTYTGALSFSAPADEPLLVGRYGYVDRIVQTCAYVELETEQRGGGVIKSVVKRWVAEVAKASEFETPGYVNMEGELGSSTTTGEGLKVGVYELDPVTAFYGAEIIAPQPAPEAKVRMIEEEWAYVAADKRCGGTSGGASIGDQRISFRVLGERDLVTVFGERKGPRVAAFRGQLLVAKGGRDALVTRLKGDRATKTWIFRGLGAILLWFGLYLVLSPALKLVTWVPRLGGLVDTAAKLVTMLLAFGLTLAFVVLGWGMSFFTDLFGGLVD